jgi:hypothetical protein
LATARASGAAPPADFTGRITGLQIGMAAWTKAQQYFAGAT